MEKTTNNYRKYAELKKQIATLSEEAKRLENEIFLEVSQIDGCKLETDFATFSLMYRPKWQYSDELVGKEQMTKLKIKQMKSAEEKSGVAQKLSDGGFLRCQVKEVE